MQITLQGKPLKELSTQNEQILKATDRQGNKYLAKLINLHEAREKKYDECLQFNIQALEQTDNFLFREHILPIKNRIANQEYMGFITEPYECTLQTYLEQEALNELQAMAIFQQVVKAIYSLHIGGYWHRNIRPQHFVLCGKIWRLESLVLNEDYSKANGTKSHYLWSSKHQPPEFEVGKQYEEEQYNQFTVWNLGSLLLQLIVCSNRISSKQEMEKFEGKMFTFQALGIKSERVTKLSTAFKELLGGMLHHNPQKRTSLFSLFLNPFVSKQVASHAAKPRPKHPDSKISSESNKKLAVWSLDSDDILKYMTHEQEERQKKDEYSIVQWKINSIVDDESFIEGLEGFSKQLTHRASNEIASTHPVIRKAIELYKSYYDQSELLMLSVECIDFIKFPSLSETEVRELILLIQHAIVLASLINLHFLAKGLNQNRNILHLSGQEFSLFQSSQHFDAFKKLTNLKCKKRAKILERLRAEIQLAKGSTLAAKYEDIYVLLSQDYLTTTFIKIKTPYRYIVKKAYDAICEQYNQNFKTPVGSVLAQRAMFITYCLTVDKLYIKAHIPDNFHDYFQFTGKPTSNYVPLSDFKEYILKAPRTTLIENSRYILKKYFAV